MLLALPHTAGCLVCGRDNPHGLHLDLSVESDTGIVHTAFIPAAHHIGFTGIAHGGVLATIFDEAMVWAATWAGRRFCYCGEMTVRFRKPALVGDAITVEANVTLARGRLISTAARMLSSDGDLLAESTGKYVPMTAALHDEITQTLLSEPGNAPAISHLAVNVAD